MRLRKISPVLNTDQNANLSSADIVPFLEQSSWGPTNTAIQDCQQRGSFHSCLLAQFNIPPSLYPVQVAAPDKQSLGCPTGSPANCIRDNYTRYPNQLTFFKNALTGQDQLRQGVAFALHQILVVSGNKERQPGYMAPYLNVLLKKLLVIIVNFLEDITLNPAMSHYLDMVNNHKQPIPTYSQATVEGFAHVLLDGHMPTHPLVKPANFQTTKILSIP